MLLKIVFIDWIPLKIADDLYKLFEKCHRKLTQKIQLLENKFSIKPVHRYYKPLGLNKNLSLTKFSEKSIFKITNRIET